MRGRCSGSVLPREGAELPGAEAARLYAGEVQQLMAGTVAEQVFFPHLRPEQTGGAARGDEKRLEAIEAEAAGHGIGLSRPHLLAATLGLVVSHRGNIQAVAEALLQQGTLTGEQVREIIGAA